MTQPIANAVGGLGQLDLDCVTAAMLLEAGA
jgi:hypothetical protein